MCVLELVKFLFPPPFAGVTVGHLQSQWLVTESEERAFVCVQAQGQTERPIDVTVFTQGGNATSESSNGVLLSRLSGFLASKPESFASTIAKF